MNGKTYCILIGIVCLIITSCTVTNSKYGHISYVDTCTGTASATTDQAGKFGKSGEEYVQTIPAVLEPNGMNFWIPQTRNSERKCLAPYYYEDSLFQGIRNSHWIVGGCTQDYGSMTLLPLSGKLLCQPETRASVFYHENEIATPAFYKVYLENYRIEASLTGTSRAAVFQFIYENDAVTYLKV